MDFEFVASGSTGNFNVIGGHIGVDIGVPWRVLSPHIHKLQLVLLTHAHG